MLVGQYQFTDTGWTLVQGVEPPRPHLILVFGSAKPASMRGAVAALRAGFPEAQVAGCTTGGEMLAATLLDGSIVATALQFERSHAAVHSVKIARRRDSFTVGRRLGQMLAAPGLRGVLILAEGIDCDGSLLLSGLVDVIGEDLPVFGGLAGDGLDFIVTRVAANGPFESSRAAVIGFYGAAIEIAHGTGDGWEIGQAIGAVTNSSGGIVHEIDHRPALAVVRQSALVGQNAPDLLSMPIWIADLERGGGGLVRTVVGVDDDRGSLILSGDVPQQGACRLVRTSAKALVASVKAAASLAAREQPSGLAFSVSYIGRKQVLGSRAVEEVAALSERIGDLPLIGFYAYGGFGHAPGEASRFHNLAICVTMISEKKS